jgi:hypothetical protein
MGQASTASGTGSVAMGSTATASGTNSVAIGNGATAAFAGSTAIGAGAATTAVNQVMIGTATNTVTMPGINSAASLAAQVGPTKFVSADGGGNLAASAYGPADISSLYGSVASLQGQVNRAMEGTAVALAMGGSVLPDNKRFAISANVGTYSGQNGGALSALMRVSNNIVLDAGVGAGFRFGGVGARGGLTVAW